jgi:hypothetical protein
MQEEFEMYIPIIASQLAAAGVAVPPEAAAVAESITAQLGAELPDLVPEPSSDPHVATLELMEAIREVGTCYTSAAALAAAHLPALLRAAAGGHPDGAVRRLAERALAGWRRIALQHLRVLVGADVVFWDCGHHAVSEQWDRHVASVGLPSTADMLDQHTPPRICHRARHGRAALHIAIYGAPHCWTVLLAVNSVACPLLAVW